MTTPPTTFRDLRDELELRRRLLLDDIDDLVEWSLRGRVRWSRQMELVDAIERRLKDADEMLLREFKKPALDESGHVRSSIHKGDS